MSKQQLNIATVCTFPSGHSAPMGKTLARAAMATALAMTFAAGLSACSATPDAVKPAALYGADGAAPTPEGTSGFPELANAPDKKPAVTSAADQKAIADSLNADRNQARSSDAALRKGEGQSQLSTPQPTLAQQKDIEKMAEAAPAAAAAPAKTASAAPAVAPVAAANAVPATQSAPAKVAAAEPAAAPATQTLAPAYVVPTAVSKATPTTTPVTTAAAAPAPASQSMLMASADTAPAGAAGTDQPMLAAGPALASGIIPMPPRGGHKTLAEVRAAFADGSRPDDLDTSPSAPLAADDEDAAPAPDAEAPVTAAPTKPVEVQPSSSKAP